MDALSLEYVARRPIKFGGRLFKRGEPFAPKDIDGHKLRLLENAGWIMLRSKYDQRSKRGKRKAA